MILSQVLNSNTLSKQTSSTHIGIKCMLTITDFLSKKWEKCQKGKSGLTGSDLVWVTSCTGSRYSANTSLQVVSDLLSSAN